MPTIRYVIRTDEKYLTDSFARSRRIGIGRFSRATIKAVAWIGLLALGFIAVAAKLWSLALLVAFLALIMLPGPRFDLWLSARKLRKSLDYGEIARIRAYDTGYAYRTSRMSGRLSWSLYSAAHRFHDGFLLVSSDGSAHWWPDSAIVEGTPAQMCELLSARVARYVVH